MRRDEFIEIIRKNPHYARKFNNSTKFVPFPSSFGICWDSKMWAFYEVDERQKVSKMHFNTEKEAFIYALNKYGFEQTEAIETPDLLRNGTNSKIKTYDGSTIIGRGLVYPKATMRTAYAQKCRSQALISRKRKKKRGAVKRFNLKPKNPS